MKGKDVFKDINCPICTNNSFTTVIKLKTSQFLNSERKSYYNLKALEINPNTYFYIKKCDQCGFVLVNPRLNEKLYSVVYNGAKSKQFKVKDWAHKEGDMSKLFETYNKYREIFPFLSTLQYYKKYFVKPKNENYRQLKLLDYGCGLGHILDLCRVFGIDGTGVEIDRFRLNHCKQKGLRVMSPKELPETEKFHIVISTSVIEHVYDLNAYFQYISTRLHKNGVFAFNGLTPRLIDIERRKNTFSKVMPLEHINYFTRKTLLKLAEKYGFREAKGYGVFAIENLFRCTYPFLKRHIFKGFYPNGNFEITLIKN